MARAVAPPPETSHPRRSRRVKQGKPKDFLQRNRAASRKGKTEGTGKVRTTHVKGRITERTEKGPVRTMGGRQNGRSAVMISALLNQPSPAETEPAGDISVDLSTRKRGETDMLQNPSQTNRGAARRLNNPGGDWDPDSQPAPLMTYAEQQVLMQQVREQQEQMMAQQKMMGQLQEQQRQMLEMQAGSAPQEGSMRKTGSPASQGARAHTSFEAKVPTDTGLFNNGIRSFAVTHSRGERNDIEFASNLPQIPSVKQSDEPTFSHCEPTPAVPFLPIHVTRLLLFFLTPHHPTSTFSPLRSAPD